MKTLMKAVAFVLIIAIGLILMMSSCMGHYCPTYSGAYSAESSKMFAKGHRTLSGMRK